MQNNISPEITTSLVQDLIKEQFPKWVHLEIKQVSHSGWDNRTFHLGDKMLVRLPSGLEYASAVEKEQYWLPKLAPLLPLPIPAPIDMGKLSSIFPYPWSIYRWIEGEISSLDNIKNLNKFAIDLANFLVHLQKIDATNGPMNFWRGSSRLKIYHDETLQAIEILSQKIDRDLVTQIWDRALASEWQKPPVWFHGDVAYGNLLVKNGSLSAVIDFGSTGIGDPSCDFVIAWTLFDKESRETFRKHLKVDDESWDRARGWGLWKALIVCAGLCGANPKDIEKSWQVIGEVVEDWKYENDSSKEQNN